MVCEVHGAVEAWVGSGASGRLPSSSGLVVFPSTWHATGALVSLAQSGINGATVKVMFVQEESVEKLEQVMRSRKAEAAALKTKRLKEAEAARAAALATKAALEAPSLKVAHSQAKLNRFSLLPVEECPPHNAPFESSNNIFVKESTPTAGIRVLNLPPKSKSNDRTLERLIQKHVPERTFYLRRVFRRGDREGESNRPAAVDLTFGSVEDAVAAKSALEAVDVDGYGLAVHFHDAARVMPLDELVRIAAARKQERARTPQRPINEAPRTVHFIESTPGRQKVVATRGLRLNAAHGVSKSALADEIALPLRLALEGRPFHIELQERPSGPVAFLTFADTDHAILAERACKEVSVGGQLLEVAFRRALHVGTLHEDGRFTPRDEQRKKERKNRWPQA